MPDAVAPPAAAGPEPAAQQGGGGITFNKLILGAGVYFALNFGINYAMRKQQTGVEVTHPGTGERLIVPGNTDDIPPYLLRPPRLHEGAKYRHTPEKVAPIWPMDSEVDIVVTVSETPQPPEKQVGDMTALDYVLKEEGFSIGNYSDTRVISKHIEVPKAVQNNGTLWGHFFVGLKGSVLDPREQGWDAGKSFYFAWPLTQYIAKKKAVKTRSLLEGKSDDPEGEEEDPNPLPTVQSYYHPNTSLAFIPDTGVMEYRAMHPAVRQFLHLETTGARDGTGHHTWYYPFLYVNTFWQLKTHMMELNDTVKTVPINLDLSNMASWQFKVISAIDASGRETARQAAYGQSAPGGGDGSEIEMTKEIFLDTNPILLGVTFVVSIAHVILETLAFGSDIAHYRKKKDNVGISVRSILANVFMQTVIFLYLLDNSQNTSWMILGGQVVGILIELWKVTTVVDIRVRPAPTGSLIPWAIAFEDKHKLSETEEKTKEYDEIAFRWMYIASVPLMVAYAIYSLVYDSHKSWYSYVITTLVGAVYAYGFLLMIPSLYINYRLKSVAHMPAKAMMYKFLNTFIDDLFAFTIKMPFLHRLATFRDDIIFFIYIYQRYAYTVDYSRVNEFGQGGDDDEPDAKKIEDKEGETVLGEKEKVVVASGAEKAQGKVKKRN